MNSIFDRIVLRYVQRRVRGEPLRCMAPARVQFGDRLIAVLKAELDARAGELDRLNEELVQRERRAAEETIRARVIEDFKDLGRADGPNLQ